MKPVVVVGAGWAGLAAAVELTRAGRRVIAVEAAPQIGGRARTVEVDDFGRIDNGQHLLLGANEGVLELLATLGIDEPDVLLRLPLDLVMRRPGAAGARLSALYLPAPLHLAAGVVAMEGITLRERIATLLALGDMVRGPDGDDMTVAAWLQLQKMPPAVTEVVWRPLTLAILNLEPWQASARLFCAVLRCALTGRRARSDLLVPRVPLGEIVPEPARRFIEGRGGEVRTSCRVTEITVADGLCTGVVAGGEEIAGDVILALPPWAAAPLLSVHPETAPISSAVERLGSAPIVTLWLRYPAATRASHPVSGMVETTAQWLFDHGAISGRKGIFSVVISGEGAHLDLDNDALAAQVAAELARLHPEWPQAEDFRVVREKRATFRAVAGCEGWRVGHETALPGLWLAGDHTATGLPATLEGAVHSGISCARMVLA